MELLVSHQNDLASNNATKVWRSLNIHKAKDLLEATTTASNNLIKCRITGHRMREDPMEAPLDTKGERLDKVKAWAIK